MLHLKTKSVFVKYAKLYQEGESNGVQSPISYFRILSL